MNQQIQTQIYEEENLQVCDFANDILMENNEIINEVEKLNENLHSLFTDAAQNIHDQGL